MTKIIDLKEYKENKEWQKIYDEFEEKIEVEAARPLTSTEQKGYRNLKRFIKNLREKVLEE
jgi:F0F1-type ATP synthase membrane subunit b/b'